MHTKSINISKETGEKNRRARKITQKGAIDKMHSIRSYILNFATISNVYISNKRLQNT